MSRIKEAFQKGKAFIPFIIISYAALIVVTFFPAIVTWLPKVCGFAIAAV